MKIWKINALVAAITCCWTMSVSAEELRIGYKAEINSADPHVLHGPNRNLSIQIYEPLLQADAYQNPQPGLAVSWKTIDPLTWEFKLREGVKFSDGTPFSAEDVRFTIERARNLKATRTFKTYLADIDKVSVVNPLTLRITTKQPSSTLLKNLATFGIVSHKAAANATEEDFNGGKAAIGTGPYKWEKWTHGESIVLSRNDNYWGNKEPWEKVTYRFIKNDTSRVAALLSGDVHVIDAVAPTVLGRLEQDKNVDLQSITSYMLNYFGLDRHHQVPLHIQDNDGKPLKTNPLSDIRVRQALSLAINRDLIVKRLMNNQSEPANQLVAPGMSGYVKDFPGLPFDLPKAKALLAEAGYPQGFRMNIQCTNDRYSNDAKVCEAVGQMLSAAGIKTSVQAMPGTTFFQRATNGGPDKEPEFSMFMVGFGSANGTPDASLSALVETYKPEVGTGANNRGRYSNPELDKLIAQARSEVDPAKHNALISQAMRMAIDDVAIVPIHFLKATWAVRSGYSIVPRTDQFTLATHIRKKAN